MKKFMSYVEKVVNDLEKEIRSNIEDGSPVAEDVSFLLRERISDINFMFDVLKKNNTEMKQDNDFYVDQKHSVINELNLALRQLTVKLITRMAFDEVMKDNIEWPSSGNVN